MTLSIRHVSAADQARVLSVVDDWWGGRNMSPLLQRLFFDHFNTTSFIIDAPDGALRAFLIGFRSQSRPDQAYIHFVGVAPAERKAGLGSALYHRFFEAVRALGCTQVRCVTSPVNRASVAYHLRLGFRVVPGDRDIGGLSVHANYDGPGCDRVVFTRAL